MTNDKVTDLMLLQVRPKILHWVELWGVWRQRFNFELTICAFDKVLDELAAVNHGSIPKDEERTAEMA